MWFRLTNFSLSMLLAPHMRAAPNIYVVITLQQSDRASPWCPLTGERRRNNNYESLNDDIFIASSYTTHRHPCKFIEVPLRSCTRSLQKIANDESAGGKSSSGGAKERAGICENKQAPGASHRRLNLTDLWFDDRLPRQRSLVPGLEMESHLRELR